MGDWCGWWGEVKLCNAVFKVVRLVQINANKGVVLCKINARAALC